LRNKMVLRAYSNFVIENQQMKINSELKTKAAYLGCGSQEVMSNYITLVACTVFNLKT
jgi:hypothetical protein